MSEPRLSIRREWRRPDPASLGAFAGASSGQVGDALAEASALDHRILRLVGSGCFVGAALPVWTAPGDNLAPFAALSVARPGDVLVLATGSHEGCAVIGDHIAGLIRNAGLLAIVTDGLIRDLHGLRQVGLPVHARGLSPRRPAKSGPGTVGLPVDVGGVFIGPGDVIVGDDDGVVVVPLEKIAEAGETLASVLRRDAENARRVKAGATEPAGLSTLLEQVGARWFP